MTPLSVMLDAPITWMHASTDPSIKAFLEDLQGNILKGHGRHHTAQMFLSFAGMPTAEIAALVRSLGQHCTSAYEQLRTNRRLPPYLDGGPIRCLFLSASGYRALGNHVHVPTGVAFQSGMESRTSILGDPARAAWDEVGWRAHAPDAMFLLADADQDAVEKDLEAAEQWLNGTGATLLVVERGLQQTRNFRPDKPAEGVEHFGYVDGRSQPLFLTEDIVLESQTTWDPVFKPSQFIVADPNGRTPLSAGSYFVFRKLEQNARGFNAAEAALGRQLFGPAASQNQLDRAGAMVVGRFEDGTPLVLSANAEKQAVTNDFTYAIDPDAAKCPFHAHIRKVNPRGDIERQSGSTDPARGRIHIMARRGITYGTLRPHTGDGSDFDDAGREPEKDIGLLFMAYMASLENQFEFTQQSWANNPGFVGNINPASNRPHTGIDSIMGQSAIAGDREHTYQDDWTPGQSATTHSFAQFVTMKGGEYFFAPSLMFLRSVGL